MKILLDNCVDWRLSHELPGFEVAHARDLGWESLSNGKLLAKASERGFDVLVTVDKNFRYQQTPGSFHTTLLTLNTILTRLQDLRELVPELLEVLHNIEPGTFVVLPRQAAPEA